MLKAVKECLKNWLVTHERLYWYIVVGLAVLGFGIVTAFGCAKLEKANAAETTEFDSLLTSELRSYRDESKPLYAYLGIKFFDSNGENPYRNVFLVQGVAGDIFTSKFDDGTFTSQKFLAIANNDGSVMALPNNLSFSDYRGSRTYELYYLEGNIDFSLYEMYDWVTFIDGRPIPTSYSPDAPYVKFDSLNVKNDIAADKGKFFDSLNYYDNFIVPAYWEYVGHMENYQNYPGAEYLLEVNFTVELPRLEYIQSLANKLDIDIQWTYNMVKWGSDLIDLWNQDSMALKNTYQFMYNFPVDIDSNGNFSFRLSYPEIENLIRYFSESARKQFNSYDSETLGILFSFLHVDSCSISVKTSSADSVLYGKSTVNHFERGVYDTCVEVEIDLDILNKSEEEIDKIIQDSISAGYEQYYKDLEDRVNSLEGQLGDVSNIQAGFGGNLETTDLWSGFTGLVQGLGSLAPAVQSLSSLTGVVLSFLPLQMSSIMATTMLAICVIAVIKAIRG